MRDRHVKRGAPLSSGAPLARMCSQRADLGDTSGHEKLLDTPDGWRMLSYTNHF